MILQYQEIFIQSSIHISGGVVPGQMWNLQIWRANGNILFFYAISLKKE